MHCHLRIPNIKQQGQSELVTIAHFYIFMKNYFSNLTADVMMLHPLVENGEH